MDDFSKLLLTFFDAVAMLMALILVLSILHRSDRRGLMHSVQLGAVFSLAALVTMSDPIDMGAGGIYDMRGLLIGTGMALLGPVVGLMTAVTALIFRLSIGPPGLESGIALIVGACAGGLVWRLGIKPKGFAQWKKSIILGLMISLQSVGIFFAPPHLWYGVLTQLIPYMVVSNVIGALVISHFLSGELSFLSAAEALRRDANTDQLTGLLNRRGLQMAYSQLSFPTAPDQGRALLYFDIDHFKSVNDSYGHRIGDDVLKHIISEISDVLRYQDIFARIGGDEFVVILNQIPRSKAEDIAERCRRVVSVSEIVIDGRVLDLSISVGAIWAERASSIDELIDQADAALYKVKQSSRNNVEFQLLRPSVVAEDSQVAA
ncbi:diguanylate cyclase [Octadecabacter sp. 1_MG-2023]|uniref:GGDEF domain-containing protein n=1 Tax=unclassified Octadecabacter TaxID=196158 RepID=UPI001C09E1CB|nr:MULTISPECIES: diguanylate cyclase [unclassified Octadecabacter]MBU2993271.1 diguanylate cyclase [Octadecabacter sp. B2R22]MDO6733274.1 diguanylate cyclase [Octadecabacter sp. 1_MG-2023]